MAPSPATIGSIPAPPGRIEALEGIRGVAVLLVVLFHAHVPGIPGAGWIGVNTFFVLSGYIITTLLLREHQRHGHIAFGRFFLRRFLRLVPALVVMLAVMAVLVRTLLSKSWVRAFLDESLFSVLQISNWDGILFTIPDLGQFLVHSWSLAIEWQFYLAWPFLLAAMLRLGTRRQAAWATGCLLIGTLAWGIWLIWQGAGFVRIYMGTDVRIGAILAGCLVALLVEEPSDTTTTRGPWPWVALAMAGILLGEVILWQPVLVHQSPNVQLTIHHPLASAAAAVGILALIKCPNGSFTRLLCNPGLVWFGTISYGLYLWHWPVLKLLDMLLLPQGLSQTAWFLLFCAPLSVVAAWLSWRFVEAPCQSLRLRFT